MALSARATRARIFMANCRPPSNPILINEKIRAIRHESDISHLRPSNFNRPLRFRESIEPKPSSSSLNSTNRIKPDSKKAVSSTSSSYSTTEAVPVFFPAARPEYSHPEAQNFKPRNRNPQHPLYTLGLHQGPFRFQTNHPTEKPPPFHIHNNPYRARKKWPPDFTNVHPKQQFHYEKTYRRRAKLKWARPTWNKWVKLVQNTLIVSTLIYFVFICEPAHDQGTPFDGFRAWFFTKIKNLGTLPDSTRAEMEKLEQEAREKAERRVAN